MNVRPKIFSVLLLLLIGLMTAVYSGARLYLHSNFVDFEKQEFLKNTKRVEQVLHHEVTVLNALTTDWAYWDDLYDHLDHPESNFIERQLPMSIFTEQNLQLAAIYKNDGTKLYQQMYNPKTKQFYDFPPDLEKYFQEGSHLINPEEPTGRSGLLLLDSGILMLSVNPISHSKYPKPNGVIVFGRFLSTSLLQDMRIRSDLDFKIFGLTKGDPPFEIHDVYEEMIRDVEFEKIVENEDTMEGYMLYPDIFGQNSFLVEIVSPRSLFLRGQGLFHFNIYIMLAAAVIGGIVLISFLEFNFLGRILTINDQVIAFTNNSEAETNIQATGNDEIAAIARNINAMTHSLKDNQLFLTQVLSSIDTGVLLINPENYEIIHANIAAARLIGVAPDELIGERCRNFTCLDDTDLCPIVDLGFSGNISVVKLRNKQGTQEYSVLRSVTTVQKEGKDLILESFTDISDLEATRQSLEMSEATYKALFNNTGTAASLVDADTTILLVNHEFENLSGYSKVEIEGKMSWTHFIHRDDLDEMISYHSKRRNNEMVPRNYQARFITRDGDTRHISFTVALLPDGKRSIGALLDITKSKQAEQMLAHQAFHDVLTGLPNRLSLQKTLEGIMETAIRHNKKVGVMLLDLDRFKNYNDSFGHEFGDEILKHVSVRLAAMELGYVHLGRLGGDEFLFIFEDLIDSKTLILSAEQILKEVERPLQLQKRDIFLGGSIGIVAFPEDGNTAEDLIKNADLAMYQSKERGKNTFTLYTKDLDKHMLERLTLETNLRHAIQNKELMVYYQPILDAETGRVWGVEALARWIKDEQFISPAQFIPVAEETNLIIPLDKFVLEQACNDLTTLANEGFGELNLSVNYSANHFKKGEIATGITSILIKNNFQSSRLYIELTETALMENLAMALDILSDVRASGVRVVLDDFGTGYSSLQYLQKLDIQALKIDKSFIQALGDPFEDSTQLVATIITMAKNLDLNVVAEGVETQDQLDFIRNQRVERAQGFYLAKPMPIEKLIEFLSEKKSS